MSNTTTSIRHRSYLYYDTNINDRQYFCSPRLEALDGNEWSLNQLLSLNPNSTLVFSFDNAGNQKQRFYCPDSNCQPPNPPPGVTPEQDKELEALAKNTEHPNDGFELDPSKSLTLYPNPTNGLLTLRLQSSGEVSLSKDVMIYNSLGVMVKKVPSNSKNHLDLDLSELSNGVYLIHVHFNNGKSITEQIIKN